MPRTPIQFQQMKDERKLSILESALFLFASHGKNSVTIDMVCQKAKCSHGLVYHYFKNVDQIYFELLKSETFRNVNSKIDIVDLDKDSYPQIRNIINNLVKIIKETKTEIAFALIILESTDKKSFYSKLTNVIEKGQNEKTITGGNPTDIASTFIYFIKGLYLTYLNQKHPANKVPSIDNIMQIFER